MDRPPASSSLPYELLSDLPCRPISINLQPCMPSRGSAIAGGRHRSKVLQLAFGQRASGFCLGLLSLRRYVFSGFLQVRIRRLQG